MREVFDPIGDVPPTKGQAERRLKSMLIRSDADIPRAESVSVGNEYTTENLNDTSATIDASPLLARGKVSYWETTLDGTEEERTHSFEIRDEGSEGISYRIADHANAL